jgi:hypothetical protein
MERRKNRRDLQAHATVLNRFRTADDPPLNGSSSEYNYGTSEEQAFHPGFYVRGVLVVNGSSLLSPKKGGNIPLLS